MSGLAWTLNNLYRHRSPNGGFLALEKQGRAGSRTSQQGSTNLGRNASGPGQKSESRFPQGYRASRREGCCEGTGRERHPKGKRLAPTYDGTPGGRGTQEASRAGRQRRCGAEMSSPSSPLTGSGNHRPPSGPARSWASGARPPWRRAPSGHWSSPLPAPAAA